MTYFKHISTVLLLFMWQSVSAETLQEKVAKLPVFNQLASVRTPFDWLLSPERSQACVYRTPDGEGIVLANAMLWRTLRIAPSLATTDYVNRMTGERMLRAVGTEGSITIDGQRYYIGGLQGQEEKGYLREEWIEAFLPQDSAFTLVDIEVQELQPTVVWKRNRWALQTEDATGLEVIFHMCGPGELSSIRLSLSLAVYDHLPVLRKSFVLENGSGRQVEVNSFALEELAMFEAESPSGTPRDGWLRPNIHVESDFQCAGSFTERETDITEHWLPDFSYTSQRNYALQTPCVLRVNPELGPAQRVAPGGKFSSFHVWEMPFDSYDRERRGLFTRRFYANIAPWTTQNPLFLHLTSTDPQTVRRAVDQCADTGYEMIIISFGSGLNMEDLSEENIRRCKELVDYAHSRGIEMGCYSLLSSRRISDETDIINPSTGKPGGMIFGSSPCLCSDWGEAYFQKLEEFMERTGMSLLEHDGSYPGNPCASTCHTYHRGLEDSQWNQYRRIVSFYRKLASKGIYMNVPDFYLMSGSTKTSIGYRETNWSLPRERQLIHARQLNYDCTWTQPLGSMWSFTPLVQYHGGGASATIEPLNEHLYEYRMHMVQNYGSGIQACYRGPRLYDTDETREMVRSVVRWYKKYRRILNSDIIHLRRPDARDWDGILHVSTSGPQRALAMLFNPLDADISRTITLPLYYTGLTRKARIREQEGRPKKYRLSPEGNVDITVTIPARGYTWLVVEEE